LIRTITAKQAKPFFWHPRHGDITDNGWMDFRACDGVCGAFHAHLWPGVWMGHLGVRKDAVGRSDAAARAILQAYALETGAERIIGWIDERNRAALAMCKRLGFEIDGRLPLAQPVIMLGWTPWAQ
jgi:hypothetical protein